jgi:alpha-beta hydrolase superfamily lysophospholipase
MNTPQSLASQIALQGNPTAVRDWPLAPDVPLRGVVLLVHGLGEHSARYEGLAHHLNDWGFAVRSYDQFGHGNTGGVRGCLPSDERLLDDLAAMVDDTRAHMAEGTPLILLGHSLGGLVAARFVGLGLRPVEALVLSSPALDPGLNLIQKLLLAVLPKIAPNLCVGNGLDPAMLSHDPAVVAAYKADPLVHDRVSGRLARFIADNGPAVIAQAPDWTTPTLLLYAGADKLVNPAGSRAFAAAAPKTAVSAHGFDTLYHEIFNERKSAPVFAELKKWLEFRF